MSFQVELHPEAVEELKESYQWYEERSEGLGVRFVTLVNKRIADRRRP